MKAIQFARLSSLLLTVFLAGTFAAEAARASALRYRLPEGVTNLYSVQIEVRGENGNETLAGNLWVAPRLVTSNILGLSLRGTLLPKRDPSNPMRPPIMYGSGGNYPRWSMPISLHEPAELQFDDCGRVLRLSGDYALPIPLGTLAQAFVEPLPAKSESRWESTDNLAVLDEPLSLGPALSFMPTPPYGMSYYAGPMGSRGSMYALVPVTRKVRYEIKSSAGGQVTIAKRLSLDSLLQFGSEPRLSASGEGEFVLDQETGLLRRAELQCKAVANSDTVTRRTTVTLKLKLLEGAEREAAQQPGPNQTGQTPKKLNREEIQKIMDDLKSNEGSARSMAASKLQSSELTEVPSGLLELMTGFLDQEDSLLRGAAAKVIADYGTAEHVPVLLKLLKDSESFSRYNIIRGLGRLKDKRAAEPLAALIASGGSDAYQAVEALSKIGADAEEAVLPLLQERHNETKRQACKVLKDVGTKKSLEPLRELMLSTDRTLSEAAGEAVRAIMARQ